MKFKCSYTELIKVSDLILIQNPKNNNSHPNEQIDRLAKIIEFQGQRSPIVVSKRSGFITKGHARLHAISRLGWEYAAVDHQEYISEAEEYADMTADNEIARWAEFDVQKALFDMKDLDLGDMDFLGLKDNDIFNLGNPSEDISLPELSSEEPKYIQRSFVLTNEQSEILNVAMKKAEEMLDCTDSLNENKNSNQLMAIVRNYVIS